MRALRDMEVTMEGLDRRNACIDEAPAMSLEQFSAGLTELGYVDGQTVSLSSASPICPGASPGSCGRLVATQPDLSGRGLKGCTGCC